MNRPLAEKFQQPFLDLFSFLSACQGSYYLEIMFPSRSFYSLFRAHIWSVKTLKRGQLTVIILTKVVTCIWILPGNYYSLKQKNKIFVSMPGFSIKKYFLEKKQQLGNNNHNYCNF